MQRKWPLRSGSTSLVSYDNVISWWPLQSMGHQSFWVGCNDGAGLWTVHTHLHFRCIMALSGLQTTQGTLSRLSVLTYPSEEWSGGLPGRPNAEGRHPHEGLFGGTVRWTSGGFLTRKAGVFLEEEVAQASDRGRLCWGGCSVG